jgi:hypothetical protein
MPTDFFNAIHETHSAIRHEKSPMRWLEAS